MRTPQRTSHQRNGNSTLIRVKARRHNRTFLQPFLFAVGGALILGLTVDRAAVPAHASWGLSIGHNNPPGANVGGNFIYFGRNFAFEFGIGSIGKAGGENHAAGSLAGDIDIKYLFGGKFSPYLEVGLGAAVGARVGEGGGVGAAAGSPFAGGGLMFQGSSLFFYGGAGYSFQGESLYWPTLGLGVRF